MKTLIYGCLLGMISLLNGGQYVSTTFNKGATGPNCSLCAVRQSVTSNGGGTPTHPESFTAVTTAGDAIVIFLQHSNWSGSGTSTISSVEGDTWHPCSGTGTGPFTDIQFATTNGLVCFYAVNIPGGSTNTITIVPSDCAANCTSIGNAIIEISGVATTAAAAFDGEGVHAQGVAGSGSNNTTCGSFTASQTNDFVICGMDMNVGTATAGTTPIAFGTLLLSGATNVAVERVVWTGSGTVNPTMTDGTTSDGYGSIVMALK